MNNYVPTFIKPYKFDIQQGNFVTKEDTAKLKIGMGKDEVRFILGTPLLNDAFHVDRWDYVFRLLKGDGTVVDSRYTVQFKDDKLAMHGGEGLPNNQADASVMGKRDDRTRRAIDPVSKEAPSSKTTTPTTPSAVIKKKPDTEAVGGTETAPELK
ncbi:MAG: outer membrane protein assembly factor BamE [Limnobacter sp.]|nr:outer membrane protein assembly factor BamE [Limnobacter sp.]